MEKAVDPAERLSQEAGEAARLLAGARRRFEDRGGRRLPQPEDGAALRREAERGDEPAEPGKRQRAGRETEKGGVFEVEGRQAPTRDQDDVVGDAGDRDAQEHQGRSLVVSECVDEVAQAEQREDAERAAEAERQRDRRDVASAGRTPGKDDRIRLHGRSRHRLGPHRLHPERPHDRRPHQSA